MQCLYAADSACRILHYIARWFTVFYECDAHAALARHNVDYNDTLVNHSVNAPPFFSAFCLTDRTPPVGVFTLCVVELLIFTIISKRASSDS